MTVRVDASQFEAAAKTLKGADKKFRLEFSRELRQIVKPYAAEILAAGAARLPKRGGLAARVAASRIGVTGTTSMRAAAVLKSVDGYDLRAMDRGILRHPVFTPKGEKGPWVRQDIEQGVFSKPFIAGVPVVQTRMAAAGERILKRIGDAS